MRKVYADNSATSFPKAPGVSDAVKDFLDNNGCNVNRGGYSDAYETALEILETRQMLAGLFHAAGPQEVIFTPSVTYSLNMLLRGFLRKGDHVITTSMEHNAVMRPLHALVQEGVAYDAVPCAKDGSLNADDILPFIGQNTKAVVMLHASNVCGTVLPVSDVAEICRKNKLRLIVDAAQTAGLLEINVQGIDALAFTGHKGLLAPQGLGGFVVKEEFAAEVKPIIMGGTGSFSHEIVQPELLPDKFESGTMNIPAIIGLKKALEYLKTTGIKNIREKEMLLSNAFISEMLGVDGVRIVSRPAGSDGYGRLDDRSENNMISVVSLDFPGRDNASVAAALDSDYGIMTRCGLHCAPGAHKTLGTYPYGTVRFSFGHQNTIDEVDYIVRSIREIIKNGAGYGL